MNFKKVISLNGLLAPLTRSVFTGWSMVLFAIYDLMFLLGILFYFPVYIWRKKTTLQALGEKLGFIPRVSDKETIWIQVVSVGEANLIGNLIRRLKEIYNCPIVISTTTLTGNKIVKSKYSHLAKIIYFPFDLSFVLRKVLKIIKPKVFIAVETEIWPNLFRKLKKKNIPIIIVNGRISNKAFRKYKLIRPLIRKVIAKCDYIGAQNEFYKERFVSLGANEKKIIVTGNMKFESISVNQGDLLQIKNKYLPLLKKGDNLLLIAASTHIPEEEIIINIYKNIHKDMGGLNLLIAPRHLQRVPQIEKIIRANNFNPVRISQIQGRHDKNNIFIIDTIGQLLYFYSLADICFVGGSLSENGGHNILEPIYFLKPTIFGPNMDNFKDIAEVTLEKGAGIQVRNKDELMEVILGLTKDTALRDNLRNKCLKVFEEEKRGLSKNLEIISRTVSK